MTTTSSGAVTPKASLSPIEAPELIFGLVAPIGVDLDTVTDVLSQMLQEMQYRAHSCRLTTLMEEVPVPAPKEARPEGNSVGDQHVSFYKLRIAHANAIRAELGNDALAALAISSIRAHRAKVRQFDASAEEPPLLPDADESAEESPLPQQAYILRQLKRPEECNLLRSVYGRQFILISAYAPEEVRRRRIEQQERASRGGLIEELEVQRIARELIAQDARESEEPHGQNVRDAFPLGDVFIDASSRVKCEESLRRFIHLLFGNNEITPTRDEYGMYMAKSASLRSSDLSRQVGAAIFRATGEIATLGCNEVPKAGGGTYWGGDEPDGRDFVAGFDPNERQRQAILVDLIERLRRGQHLSDELLAAETSFDVSKKLLEVKGLDSVKESKIMDLIEFGRVIHAEMSAISDASRNGVAIGGGSLFCTTFPCHLCATNIIAAGLRRVVYLEPYPKSYASNLHTDSIVVDADNPGDRTKVHFDAFIGVSPYRYRDLFEKSRRKSSGGSAQRWQGDTRRPLIEVYFPQYSKAEQLVMSGFKAGLARLQPTKARLPESPTEEPASKPASTPRPPGSLSKTRKR